MSARAQITNRDAVRSGLVPCAWEPSAGRLAKVSDPFHAAARKSLDAGTSGVLDLCTTCHDWLKTHLGTTPEQRRARALKAAAALTPEQRRARALAGARARWGTAA